MCCVSGSAAEKDLLCLCVFTIRLQVVLLLVEAADLLQFRKNEYTVYVCVYISTHTYMISCLDQIKNDNDIIYFIFY